MSHATSHPIHCIPAYPLVYAGRLFVFFFLWPLPNSAGGLMESKNFGLSTVPKKRGESVLICMLVDEEGSGK